MFEIKKQDGSTLNLSDYEKSYHVVGSYTEHLTQNVGDTHPGSTPYVTVPESPNDGRIYFARLISTTVESFSSYSRLLYRVKSTWKVIILDQDSSAPSTSGYGLEIINSSNKVLFSTAKNYLRVRKVTSYSLGNTFEYTGGQAAGEYVYFMLGHATQPFWITWVEWIVDTIPIAHFLTLSTNTAKSFKIVETTFRADVVGDGVHETRIATPDYALYNRKIPVIFATFKE